MKDVVMLLSNGFDPDVRVHKEAKTLVEGGYNVTVFAWDRVGKRPEAESIDGISIERLRLRSGHNKPILNAVMMPISWLCFSLSLLSKKYDAVHCHDFDTFPAGFIAGKLRGKKVIYDAHESYPGLISEKLPRPAVRLVELLERFMSKRCDLVITVNDKLAGVFAGYGKKASVIMNCQRLEEYSIDKAEIGRIRKKINPKNRFLITYIGGFLDERCLEEMILALGILKKGSSSEKAPMLALFGRGPLEGKLRELVKEENLEDLVYFGGAIKPSEVASYTLASDLIPVMRKPGSNLNIIFSSPNKLFEAIAGGKPVIANDVGIIGDVIRKEGAGILVDGDDPHDIANGLKHLLADKKEYEKLAKGAKSASLRYNWENEGKKLLGQYRGL